MNISDRLGQLDEMVNSTRSTPVNWQNYLRNGITELNTGLDRVSREDLAIKGFPKGMSGNELISFWKSVWIEFADTLKAWPDIRHAAEECFNE